MLASVCVATYNRADRLPALFSALAEQDAPAGSFEVIVTDDGSRDDTPQVLARLIEQAPFPARALTQVSNGGAARARNAAWRAASGERVLFTDDDCVPSRRWVSSHLAAARTADVVVGRTGPADDEIADGPFARVLRVNDARFFATCNVSYRRADLEAVDGFDERFRFAAGEDTDLGLRLTERGACCAYDADAFVVHPIRHSSLRAALAQSSRWADLALVVRKHPNVRRTLMHRRVFWKATHPPVLVALGGVALAAGLRSLPWSPMIVAATAVPWLHRRRDVPARALPGTFLLDLVEVTTMVRGSLHHRTLIL